ncbi:MAG: hypothetical protein GOMPHAMPRED_007941 [Gomphillus americanus]|uniref:Ubiquitin thioesterase OTU n=1 Tax=Gomphillus americanus TaxID=1940652 RepID=A0A8H3F056_9LECA|nr:MAG: hypothetical protein GOMPHAMPRED_007941 [Gomphillus americanus]
MRIRIRGPTGQQAVVLPDNPTVADLKKAITQSTLLNAFDIKYGYPPRTLDLTDYQEQSSLEGFNLNGEQLTISPIEETRTLAKQHNATNHVPPARTSELAAPLTLSRNAPEDPPEIPAPSHAGTLVLRIMPDDNSCLFRAFGSAYFGDMDNMYELRSIIAQTIQQDTETYSAVVLDKAPDEYCRWIQNPDAWGGSIELQILSNHFNVEICSIDVQSLRIDKYNEGQASRCILVYSGIHYDVIAISPSDPPFHRAYAPPDLDRRIFDSVDNDILVLARKLCKSLQRQGYFTDTAGFRVKCNVCGDVFTGEKGAVDHAEVTGHTDFGEA